MDNVQHKRLAGAAVIVMSSIVMSRITGFLRTTLITNIFEQKSHSDALFSAFTITNLMYNMLVGGAIAAALIPVLSGYIARKEEEEGWKAVSTFINAVFISMVFLGALGVIFSPQLVDTMAAGYRPEVKLLIVKLTRILFPSVGFIMLAGMVNGVLNSYQRFAVAAYGPSVYNLGCIVSLLSFNRYGVVPVAAGIMTSAMFYFFFQLSFALKNMKHYRPALHLRHEGFIKLVKLAIPALLASSITQVNSIVSQSYTSFFDEGSVTALNNANDIWQLPWGIFAMGMGTAVLPTLSEKLALGQTEDFKDIFHRSLRAVLFLTIPSATAFIVLGGPISSAIFKWSGRVDVRTTASILNFFAPALLSQSFLAILNRSCYASNDTRTPLLTGGISIGINASLCYLFVRRSSFGVESMALAYSLASIVNAALLIYLFRRKLKVVSLKEIAAFFLKASLASAVMGIGLYFVNSWLPVDFLKPFSIKGKVTEAAALLAEVVIGLALYLAAAAALKIREFSYIRSLIPLRFPAKGKKGM